MRRFKITIFTILVTAVILLLLENIYLSQKVKYSIDDESETFDENVENNSKIISYEEKIIHNDKVEAIEEHIDIIVAEQQKTKSNNTTTKKKSNKTSTTKTSNKSVTTKTSNKTTTKTSNKTTTTKTSTTTAKTNNSTFKTYTSIDPNVEYSYKFTDFKYGVRIVHVYRDTYYTDEDGNRKLKSSVEDENKKQYDYSSYNATPNDLIPEAKENINSTKSIITETINYVSKYRKEAGIKELIYDESLTIYANVKVLDMYYGKYFAHESKTGLSWGYIGNSLNIKSKAENIAKGYAKPIKAVDAFYKSSLHKKNMLNSAYTKIGIGYKNGYWVQEFS